MRRFLSLFTMLMLCGVLAFAQNRVVSGKVTDTDGKPVPYATVKIKGGSVGLPADANGAFSIKVKDGDVLEISSASFEMQRITIRNTTGAVNVQLKAAVSMEGVVVTGYGIKRQAKEIGYSAARVNTDELNQAKVTSIATGLAGKVSGMAINLVNNSVKPDVRILLRGTRSLTGNNQPLLVIDGVQMSSLSYLASLNPNDVDNVTVLKGGSASAVYGSDGSNGVIIVTTKKGTTKTPVIKLSSTASFESIAYMPEFQNEFGQWGGEPANAPGMIVFPEQPGFIYAPYENQNYGPRYNGQKVPIGGPVRVYRNDGSFFTAQDSAIYSAKPNAKRAFFDKALTFTNDVSYAAGDDKSKFFFSFQDVNTKGVLPGDVNRRDAIRANGSRESGIWRVDYTVGYTISKTNTSQGSYFQDRPLYWTIINQPANVDLRNYRNWRQDPFASPDGYFNAYYGNPWWQIDAARLDERNNDLIGSFSIGVKPVEWLDISYKVGYTRNDYSNKYTREGYNFADWAIADVQGAGNIPSGVKVLSPTESDAMSYSRRLTGDFMATLHKTHKNFDYKFIVGSPMLDGYSRSMNMSATSLVIPGLYNIGNRLGEANVSEGISQFRRVGAYVDLTVGFKNYLFLHGSARNDWDSRLAEKNRSFFYPGADISFVFSDAFKALQNNKSFLSYGKLRGGYSKTGNVNVGVYSLANTFDVGGGFPFGSIPGFTVNGSYKNPNLKPEFITDLEVGLDLGFLKNRINLSGTVYKSNSINQTLTALISPATGFTSSLVNDGEVQNRGYEIDLKLTPLLKSRSGIRWDVGANYSYNESKVIKLNGGTQEISLGNSAYATVGKPYPQLKVSDWKRDADGHIIVDKNTGYPSRATATSYMGTSTAPTRVGINTSVSYKGFTLSAVADGRFGAVIDNAIGSSLDFTGVSAYSAQSGRQPFVIPNTVYFDGAKYVPNTNINTQNGNLGFWANTWNTAESNYVTSADFWKLREVSLGYSVPKKVLTGYIKAISMQVTGRNLFTKKAKENMWTDPEFANTTGNSSGVTDINQLPPTKFVQFSLNFTF